MVGFFGFIIFIILLIVYVLYQVLESIKEKIENYIYFKSRELNKKKQKEDALDDIMAIKIYQSGVDLYNKTNNKENKEKINMLMKMYNIKSINNLRRLYKRAEKMLIEARNEECEIYKKEKKQAMLTYKNKYNPIMLKSRMFDDDTDKIYKLFKITNVNGEIQENKNLVVSFDIKFKEDPKILNKDAVIDGSLEITIYDLDKNVIADGYCVCEGFGLNSTTSYLDRVGFYHSHYEVKCIPKDYNKINLKANQTFNISIKPINLWMMEKNIFNDSSIKQNNKYSYPKYIKNDKMNYDTHKIETEHFYCERCFKKISEEEYELNDCMCEDCFMDVHIDDKGDYHDEEIF